MIKNKLVKQVFIAIIAVTTAVSLAGLSGLFMGGGNSPQSINIVDAPTSSGGAEDTATTTGEIPCSNGDTFKSSIHLTVFTGNKEETIPGGIGISENCTREINTKKDDGTIYIESDTDNRSYTLADFMAMSGLPLSRPGYFSIITVGGEDTSTPYFKLEDGQDITLRYISFPSSEGSQ